MSGKKSNCPENTEDRKMPNCCVASYCSNVKRFREVGMNALPENPAQNSQTNEVFPSCKTLTEMFSGMLQKQQTNDRRHLHTLTGNT